MFTGLRGMGFRGLGFVLFGVYGCGGVRIVNCLWCKGGGLEGIVTGTSPELQAA